MKLVTERSVTLALAARDSGVHVIVLRVWVREHRVDLTHAFPGHGAQTSEAAKLTRPRREVARLKLERDILKKSRPTLRRSRSEVQLRCETPRDLAGGRAVWGARGLAQWLRRVGHNAVRLNESSPLRYARRAASRHQPRMSS